MLDAPGIRMLRQQRYREYFATATTGFPFYGTYGSVAEARAAAPRLRKWGFDHAETASIYEAEMGRMVDDDVPAARCLGPLLRAQGVVFDHGGHVGTKYRAFSATLAYPAGLRWIVCDVPSIVAAGRERAAAEHDPHLEFTTEFIDAEGADVLFASGALQYLDRPIWDSLDALRNPPRDLILHRLPLHDGGGFTTLQNIQVSIVPYTVSGRRDLMDRLSALGYELREEWPVGDRKCVVPFHPELLATHVGMHWRRTAR